MLLYNIAIHRHIKLMMNINNSIVVRIKSLYSVNYSFSQPLNNNHKEFISPHILLVSVSFPNIFSILGLFNVVLISLHLTIPESPEAKLSSAEKWLVRMMIIVVFNDDMQSIGIRTMEMGTIGVLI